MADRLAQAPVRVPDGRDAAALVLDRGGTHNAAVLALVRSALADASHLVFVALLVTAVLIVGALLLTPRRPVGPDDLGAR